MLPSVILLFSGKRKSGKDYLTNHLQNTLPEERCEVIKISAPIKSHWAKENNLNLVELMGHNEYKEQYRMEMIRWSDNIREQDYGYFCREACAGAKPKPIWIVSDIRRKTDIQWFQETYGNIIKTIRITVDDETRRKRGFQFVEGIDDVASECDLDHYDKWDLIINNDDEKQELEEQMKEIISLFSHVK